MKVVPSIAATRLCYEMIIGALPLKSTFLDHHKKMLLYFSVLSRCIPSSVHYSCCACAGGMGIGGVRRYRIQEQG